MTSKLTHSFKPEVVGQGLELIPLVGLAPRACFASRPFGDHRG